MFPILFQVGSVKVVTLPIVLFFALVFGIFLFWREVRREYFNEIEIFDLSLILILGMIFGGKILEFSLSVLRFGFVFAVFRFWNEFGAFSFWGAIIGAAVAAWLFSRSRDWHFFAILDFGSIAASGALVLVWFGNLLAGSAYGVMTNSVWGISSPYLLGKRQPTQILGIIIFLLIFLILKRLTKRVHFEGFFVSWFLMLSAIFLFFLEFLRGDSVYLSTVRVNQIFSVVFFIFGILIFYKRSKRNVFSDLQRIPIFCFRFLKTGYLFSKKVIFNLRISAKYKVLSLKRRH